MTGMPISGAEGFQVDDWAFGLVDRNRQPKPAYLGAKKYYAHTLPALYRYPKVS